MWDSLNKIETNIFVYYFTFTFPKTSCFETKLVIFFNFFRKESRGQHSRASLHSNVGFDTLNKEIFRIAKTDKSFSNRTFNP